VILFALLITMPPLHRPAGSAADIDRLIGQLGSEVFAEREAASTALEQLGEAALEPLRKAREASDDAEIRRRAERLLATPRAIAVRIDQLIKQLSSPSDEEREATNKALEQLGELALQPLRKAGESCGDAEVQRRARRLVAAIELRLLQEQALAIRLSCLSPEDKGQKLKAMLKKGMTGKEVLRLLGMPSGTHVSTSWSMGFWGEYSLAVKFDRDDKLISIDPLLPKE
jgi:hypothetical protein